MASVSDFTAKAGIIDILYFEQLPNKPKNKIPFKSTDLQEHEELSTDFCKRNPDSHVQKKFFCRPCKNLIESMESLREHVKGGKHVKNLKDFDPYAGKPDYNFDQKRTKEKNPRAKKHWKQNDKMTLEEKLKDSTLPVTGLRFVQEFVSERPKDPRLYKCMLFHCDGAWGNSRMFADHVTGKKHIANFFLDKDNSEKREAERLPEEELLEKAKQFDEKDFSVVQVIRDQERYEIQRGRFSGYKNRGPTTTKATVKSDGEKSVKSENQPEGGSDASTQQDPDLKPLVSPNQLTAGKRKLEEVDTKVDVKKAKLETKALKAKRPGFTDERYNETSYYYDPENNLRKVYPYYFTFTTFTKGRWVGERILDVFAREFRAHPAEEYERCIKAGTLTVNYEKVDVDYRLKHNDLLANIVHRHEVPVSAEKIKIIHMDDDLVVVNKPASIPVHPCGRYRHNTVVFILAKEHGLKNLRTIHRLDRLTSGLLLFGRNPKKAREMEQQIRTRQVKKEYLCRVDGEFPVDPIECKEPIEVVSYKIGVCKVSPNGKDCHTDFHRLSYNGRTSVVLCRPHTGRMHQIRVHLQYLGYPVVNDPLYNHTVFGPEKGKGGRIGKSDDQLIQDLIAIHNAENWLGMDEEGLGPVATAATADIKQEPKQVVKSPTPPSGDNRADTPDSAVDVQSLPASADSPSCNSSPGGSRSPNDFNVEVVGVACSPKEGGGAQVGVTTIATQTGIDEVDSRFDQGKLTMDQHCYECKVKYRDPRPKDLVMFLHAWKYSGPEWFYSTDLPSWAKAEWVDPEEYLDSTV